MLQLMQFDEQVQKSTKNMPSTSKFGDQSLGIYIRCMNCSASMNIGDIVFKVDIMCHILKWVMIPHMKQMIQL